MEIELKNPRFTENGDIDVELNHPVLGWIPFTASKHDEEEFGRMLYEKLLNGNFGKIKKPEEYDEDYKRLIDFHYNY
ncbi:MAG: hypothetical protein ACOCRK_00090 [bacterium]